MVGCPILLPNLLIQAAYRINLYDLMVQLLLCSASYYTRITLILLLMHS